MEKKIQLQVIYGLEGFNADSNNIRINPNLLIKKVSIEKRTKFYDRAKNMTVLDSIDTLIKNEFLAYYNVEVDRKTFISNPYDIVYYKVEYFNQILRTYSDGKVHIRFYEKYVKNNKSNIYESIGFTGLNTMAFNNENIEYSIKKSQLTDFKKYFQTLEILDLEKNKPLRIALNRFNSSYYKREWEDKLIDLMICYEALFLKEEERFELNFRLALRVSKFLGGKDQRNIFELIKKSYDLRSKVVHGSETKKEITIGNDKLPRRVIVHLVREVLRECIQKIILKYPNQSIKEIINKIDDKIINY